MALSFMIFCVKLAVASRKKNHAEVNDSCKLVIFLFAYNMTRDKPILLPFLNSILKFLMLMGRFPINITYKILDISINYDMCIYLALVRENMRKHLKDF